MSSASSAHSSHPSFGGLLVKILIIAVIWAALVFGTLHYVGNVWPKAMQVSQAVDDAANEKAMEALKPAAAEAPKPAAAAAAGSTTASPTAAPAKASGSAAPAASASAAPAASSAPAVAATPAASAPKASGEAKLPKDPSLAGYDRSAMWNVAIFYSIVISVLSLGAIIVQVFKYCHVEEEEHAH